MMHLLPLTSLRFCAALLVVLSHLSFLTNSTTPATRWVAEHLFKEGYIGVTFFFILSGFILSFSYGEKLATKRIDYPDYLFSRIARIFPLHLLTLIIALPLLIPGVVYALKNSKFPFEVLALNAALLQAFFMDSKIYFSMNAPSWSLSVELFFYVLLPLLLKVDTIRLVWLAIIIFASQYLSTFVANPDQIHFLIYIFPPSRLADFISGILLYRLYVHLPDFSDPGATRFQFASIILLAAFIYAKDHIAQSLRYDFYYVLPMALIVFSFARKNGYLAGLISGRVFVLLGEASFSLYLIHQLIIRYIEAYQSKFVKFTGFNSDVSLAIMCVLISLIGSVVVHKCFENPARRMALHYLQKTRLVFGKSKQVA